jgi:hypothetical protein
MGTWVALRPLYVGSAFYRRNCMKEASKKQLIATYTFQ